MSVLTPDEATGVAAARFTAMTIAPYFASALAAMTFVRTPDLGTVGVDARLRVYVDPVVIERWTTIQMAGALLHEVNHVIRGHHDRGAVSGVSAELWNIAGDLEINDDLVAAEIELPDGALLPDRYGLPEHELAEWYATQLVEQVDAAPVAVPNCGSGAGGRCGAHELGESADVPGVDPARIDRIRDAVARALLAAGNAPAGLERWARAHLRSDVPWNAVLVAAIRRSLPRGAGHHRHSWSRPRRHNPTAVVLPSLRGVPVHVAVVVDTSASMDDDHLDLAASDIATLRSIGGVERVTVVSCDTEAVVVDTPRRGGSVGFVGGGGTSLAAGLDHLTTLRNRPDLTVVITDGHTPWPDEPPPRCGPVIALVPGGAPHGPIWMTTIERPVAPGA